MRRLVALLVVALAGAILYGVSGLSSGVSVNSHSLSRNSLDAELAAITQNSGLACYLNALDPASYVAGAGGDSVAASAAAVWTNFLVEGLAINQYVTSTLKYRPTTAELSAAKSSLEGEMTAQAANASPACVGTSAQALAAMPAEMRTDEIQDQASSLYLVQKLKDTIPLTASAMKKYFAAHRADYDTLCVSIALVQTSEVSTFDEAETAGTSVAALAKKYSQDPTSAKKGGAYGCYPPSSESYAGVRADVANGTLNQFPATPQYINYNNGVYALFVAVTARTATPYAQAAQAVLSDLQTLNAEAANKVKNSLLYAAAVHVDPSVGQWGLNTTGPQVFAPSVPAKTNVAGSTKLTAGPSTYQ